MEKQFRITYTCVSDLSVDDIWPDGNAPCNPKCCDVKRIINEEGGIYKILNDWALHENDSNWKVDVKYVDTHRQTEYCKAFLREFVQGGKFHSTEETPSNQYDARLDPSTKEFRTLCRYISSYQFSPKFKSNFDGEFVPTLEKQLLDQISAYLKFDVWTRQPY